MVNVVHGQLLFAGKLMLVVLVVVDLHLFFFHPPPFSFKCVRAASPTALAASCCKLADAEVVASAVWNI